MPDTLTEHRGDCCICYQVETPKEYNERTGRYIGGDEPALVGHVTLYIMGKPSGTFQDRETARLHLSRVAKVAEEYPILRA